MENNRVIDIFIELGRRLETFRVGEHFESIVRDAVAANPWFTPDEIRLTVRNIAGGMLSVDILTEWLEHYPALPVAESRKVLIIMAGNVPFVGMQDLLCVLAAGHRAIVKPSSKDSVLMSWVVSELLSIAPDLYVSIYSGSEKPDAVIAMGGNEAVASIGGKYPDIPLLLRGSRSSVAVLDGEETSVELTALADDILTYSGLGCRNVSFIFVPRVYDFERLQNALSEHVVCLNPKYRNNYMQTRAMLQMNTVAYKDCGSCLLVEEYEFPTDVSRVNYAFYDDIHEVADWLAEHDPEIQCVSGNRNIAHSRAVDFGKTQQPTISDYPDGRDTMEFLLHIK